MFQLFFCSNDTQDGPIITTGTSLSPLSPVSLCPSLRRFCCLPLSLPRPVPLTLPLLFLNPFAAPSAFETLPVKVKHKTVWKKQRIFTLLLRACCVQVLCATACCCCCSIGTNFWATSPLNKEQLHHSALPSRGVTKCCSKRGVSKNV